MPIDSEDSIKTVFFGHKESEERIPEWLNNFFGEGFDEDEALKLFSSSASVVIIVSLMVKNKEKKFAICFGHGWQMLDRDAYEEGFGLKIVLNSIDSERIKAIDKKDMSASLKSAKEQMPAFGDFVDFGINETQDLLQGVTGEVLEEDSIFGSMITGTDAFSVSAKVDINNLEPLLKECLDRFNSKDYAKKFPWVDYIKAISKPARRDELNKKLLEKIKTKKFENLSMSIPEVLEWEKVKEFRYEEESLGDDISIETVFGLQGVNKITGWTVDKLRKKKIECIDNTSENVYKIWSFWQCLYCEEKDNDGKTCIFENGKWYEVEDDFAKKTKNEFNKIANKGLPKGIVLPSYKLGYDKDGSDRKAPLEADYNKMVGNDDSFLCLDKKLIRLKAVGNSPIEFCDLLSGSSIIHVKNYGASSKLSHLFSQGLVSSRLLAASSEFREKVKERINDEKKESNKEDFQFEISSSNNVVYAVMITKDSQKSHLPFFSQVNFLQVVENLNSMRFEVFFTSIEKEKKKQLKS